MVDTTISLGDCVKVNVSTDFPFLNFRHWRAVSWKGESVAGDHGFTLREEDFKVFEENMMRCVHAPLLGPFDRSLRHISSKRHSHLVYSLTVCLYGGD